MVRNKLKLLLFLLLMALPAELSAVSDDAKVLMNRQFALYDTDSVDAFKDVTARLKQLLEKEGEAEKLYDVWYNEIMYLTYISSNLALEKVAEMKDYAQKHDSKYGFYMATISNAFIASDMGMKDRVEKLLKQAIDYKERNLPNLKLDIQIYGLLADINDDKKQWDESVRILDEALRHNYWNANERVILATMRCNSALSRVPPDSVKVEKCYEELHRIIEKTGYTGTYHRYVDTQYALYKHQYGQALDYSRTIFAPETRISFVVEALVGLRRYKEALDSFRVLKDLTDKFYNEETRHRTEKNALELQASRAENEATTLRLKQQRTLLTAIVCGLLLIAFFLVIYLRRRQQQIRQLKQAYDQLEEVTTQKERIESELRIARDIQMSMVPMVFPDHPGLDLFASMAPARHRRRWPVWRVSGDEAEPAARPAPRYGVHRRAHRQHQGGARSSYIPTD